MIESIPLGFPYNTGVLNRRHQTAGQLVTCASFLPGGLRDPDAGTAALAHGGHELFAGLGNLAVAMERGGIGRVIAKHPSLQCPGSGTRDRFAARRPYRR